MMMGYEDVVVAGYHDPVGSMAPVCRCEPPYPRECPGRGVTLAEFLLARIAEDEEWSREMLDNAAWADRQGAGPMASPFQRQGRPRANRLLAECEAKRRIIEWHQNWPVFVETVPTMEPVDGLDVNRMTLRMSKQIAWMTEQQYRAQFGDEPPTSPILLMLAQPYVDHPDFRDEWRQ